MRKETGALRLLLAVTVVTACGAPAAAQTAEADRPAVRIGPVEVRPRLTVSNLGIDYNVFNEHTDPKQDFTFTAAPGVELSVHPGRLRLAVTSASELVYFRKYTSERSVNRSVGARLDLDLTWLKPFASVSSATTSTRPNAEIDARARHQPRSYSAGTTIKVASRTGVTLLARRSRETYDDIDFRGEDLSRALNHKTTAYDGSFNIDLTPFTTFSVVVSREQERFDLSPIRDSDSIRVAPTVTFSPLGLITGTASAGYRKFNGLDASLADFSGFVASGGVSLVLASRYKIDTTFGRDIRYSYEEALPYYIYSGGRGTLAMQTFGPFDVRVLAGLESMRYRKLGGGFLADRDTQRLYGGGVGYRIKDGVRLVVQAEFTERRSGRDEMRAYKNHRFVGTVTWGVLN